MCSITIIKLEFIKAIDMPNVKFVRNGISVYKITNYDVAKKCNEALHF